MIFKKPYAFLIKHFRLINFIIAILSGYILYKNYQIIAFFRDYVTNSYSGTFYTGFYQEYVSPVVIFVLILILIGIAFICLLFIHKKKNVKFYPFSIIFYIILLIYFIVIRNLMIGLEEELLTAEVARICRDISIIALIIQIPYIISFLARFFGFNIGKYDFKEDLKELQISEQDSEEVELTLNQDSTKLKRFLRRFKREFFYYVKENKFIFIVICVILTGLIGFLIYKSLPSIIDHEYNQGDLFAINNLSYRVEDSIITNLDYQGNIIDKDKYYLVVKLYIENNGQKDANIDYNNFRLELGKNNYVYPSKGKENNFVDYAKNSFISNLKVDSKNTYSLIFELNNEDIKKRYNLKVANGVVAVDNQSVGRFNYITITPIIIDKVNQEGLFEQGDKISFMNSNLGNSTLTVSNATTTNKYVYDYKDCRLSEECTNYKDMIIIDYKKNDKTLLVMDYDFTLDETVPFYTKTADFNKFINLFIKIKYIKNEKEYYIPVKNVTPNNLVGKFALEVSSEAMTSNNKYLSITIRNKEYLVNLK